MKFRHFAIPLILALAYVTAADAGLRDRSSTIELYGDKDAPGNYMRIPEISSAPATADTGWAHVSVRANDIYFKDDLGVETSMIGAASGAATNLDEAYDGGGAGAGREIAVDQGAVLLTGTNAANVVLDARGATASAVIDITQTGAGNDISGTSGTWKFSKAGLMTLANGFTQDNGTDTILEWNENSEEILWDFETNALDLDSTSGVVTLNVFDGSTGTITHAADGEADDFTLSLTGAQDSSLIMASSGTGADALQITTSAGGIDMTISGGAAGEDIDLTADTSINLSSTEDAANAIKLLTNGGTSETIVVTNTQGTSDAAIDINGTAGGVDIDAGGPVGLTSAENTTDAVVVEATAGGVQILASGAAATEDILVTATGSSIKLNATEAAADAITITAATAAGGIDISSQADIDITTTGAAGEDITITNTGGSIAITATEAAADAVTIGASAAGGDVNIDSVLGRIELEAEEDAASAIHIIADGGTSSGIILHNDTGTGDESILLDSDAGGITINANAGSVDIEAVGGTDGDIGITAGDDLTMTATGKIQHAGELLMQAETVTAANTITRAECGKYFYLDADAEFQSILPDISAVDAGCELHFVIADAASGADYTVVTGNTLENVIYGSVIVNSTHVPCSAEDTITLDDGILEGDWVSFNTDGTLWYINGSAVTAGDIVCSQAD